jgi:hypothetical protein
MTFLQAAEAVLRMSDTALKAAEIIEGAKSKPA